MNTIEVLRKAKELISSPEHWTQGVYARDKHENEVSPSDPKAYSFCAMGAVDRIFFDYDIGSEVGLMCEALLTDVVSKFTGLRLVSAFNDTSIHEEVLLLFDDSIRRAEALENGTIILNSKSKGV